MKKAIILLYLVLIILIYGCSDRRSTSVEEFVSTENVSNSITKEESEHESIIYVYVCGCVKNPGVYKLSEGARVCEALELAGGILDEATVDNLNLAALLSDGEKIYVYSVNEISTMDVVTDAVNDGKVNINTATSEELMTLPGIGEAKALAIINYREEVGHFEVIEDIMNISGIKESVFNKIKNDICVG